MVEVKKRIDKRKLEANLSSGKIFEWKTKKVKWCGVATKEGTFDLHIYNLINLKLVLNVGCVRQIWNFIKC
jgi:hypothetical protein